MPHAFVGRLVVVFALAAVAPPAFAQVGSGNTTVADPPVARPSTTPCKVQLFDNLAFADFSVKSFAYAPPAGCPGPWAKVVLSADFNVTAGRQFDRTANLWIGGVNIYFGTTAEPSGKTARSWHVERDLTDYSALFASAQAGEADLGNLVNDTYTGIIYGSATLELYPLGRHAAAPRSADVVLPLSDRATGGTVSLGTSSDRLARSFSLPTNVERAYLDVIAQSQGGDEFWYTCVPDDVSGQLQSCGGGPFRETEVYVDGALAGVAPVYPWIFTGGIDPYLWEPVVGVETLSFTPDRVDLTPFAGLLSDGKPHEVAIGVFGANNYFSATGSLLLYLDHGAKQTAGAVTLNTLGLPSPVVTKNLTTASDGSISGTVSVSSLRTFTIAGYVDTSHGRVRTEIVQHLDFVNQQSFVISATQYQQNIEQKTTIAAETHTSGRGPSSDVIATSTWPLSLGINYVVAADGSATQTTRVEQRRDGDVLGLTGGLPSAFTLQSDAVTSTDTLGFNAAGGFTGPTNGSSSQSFFAVDGLGSCYAKRVESKANLVTAISSGDGCL